MTTAFATIAQAMVDALLAAPAVAGGRVSLPRRHEVPADWPSHVEVRLQQADGRWPYVGAGSPGQWESAITIDVYVRPVAAGGTAYAELDDILSAVATRVSALSPAALGVVDIDRAASIRWDWAEAGAPFAQASYSFIVRHDTRTPALGI